MEYLKAPVGHIRLPVVEISIQAQSGSAFTEYPVIAAAPPRRRAGTRGDREDHCLRPVRTFPCGLLLRRCKETIRQLNHSTKRLQQACFAEISHARVSFCRARATFFLTRLVISKPDRAVAIILCAPWLRNNAVRMFVNQPRRTEP
jgi:hypothetical protein